MTKLQLNFKYFNLILQTSLDLEKNDKIFVLEEYSRFSIALLIKYCSTVLSEELFIQQNLSHDKHDASILHLNLWEDLLMNNPINEKIKSSFGCHSCIGLFFKKKSDLKSHLRRHDSHRNPIKGAETTKMKIETVSGEILPSLKSVADTELTDLQPSCVVSNAPCESHLPSPKYSEPDIMLTLNELPPLPNPNLATRSDLSHVPLESDEISDLNGKHLESESEPLSGLVGSSLHALFSTDAPKSRGSRSIVSSEMSSLDSFFPLSKKIDLPFLLSDCTDVEKTINGHCSSAATQSVQLEDTSSQFRFYSSTSCSDSGGCLSPSTPTSSFVLLGSSSCESLESCSSSGFSSGSIEDGFESEQQAPHIAQRNTKLIRRVSVSKKEVPPASETFLDDLNIDNIVLSCLFCENLFFSIKATRSHMVKSHQSGEKTLECIYCQKHFKNCDSLVNHLCSNHSDVYFACISCKVRFESKTFLDIHFQSKHNSENANKMSCRLSQSKHTDDILHQLNCIPYYINQNRMGNSISKKIKQRVFDKLCSNETQNSNNFINGTEKSLSHAVVDSVVASNKSRSPESKGVILKRKSSSSLNFDDLKKQMKSNTELCIPEDNFWTKAVPTSLTFPTYPDKSKYNETKNEIGGDSETDAKAEYETSCDHNLCLFCNKICSSVKGVKTHIAQAHKLRRGGKICLYCKINYKTTDLLFKHLNSQHFDLYFACNSCKIRFDSKLELMNHFESKHNSINMNNKTVSEDLSSNRTESKESFMKEIGCFPNNSSSTDLCVIMGVENENQTLENIDTSEVGSNTVQYELLKKIGKNRSFCEKISDNDDKYNHTDAYYCLLCNARFINDFKACKLHMSMHKINLFEKCVFCKTRFDHCDLLLKHLRSNHADLYFECTLCEVRFGSQRLLKSHIHYSHDEIPRSENKDALSCNSSLFDRPTLSKSALQQSPEEKKEESAEKKISQKHRTRLLVNFSHPDYSGIENKDFSGLELMVQWQVTKRVEKCASAKSDSKNISPMHRPNKGLLPKREFSGEWAQAKNYFCANCGAHFAYFWDFDMHRWEKHPLTTCSVYDFYVDHTPPCYFDKTSWPYIHLLPETKKEIEERSNIIAPVKQPDECTKCLKSLPNSIALRHRHIILCDQDVPLSDFAKCLIQKRQSPRKMYAHKRKRYSYRGLKSVIDTPPKKTPAKNSPMRGNIRLRSGDKHSKQKSASKDKSIKTHRKGIQKVIKRQLDFHSNRPNPMTDFVLLSPRTTRRQSVISDIDDEKTKELIEEIQRGKYNINNT